MIALLTAPAHAQTYAFPSIDDHAEFYPTAYVDHGGVVDWNCGSLTYAGHHGNDFGCGGFPGMDAGRTVTAAADGVVIATNDGEFDRCTTGDCYGGGGFGNYAYIQHPDGKITIYGHMKQWSVLVNVGDQVVCGQPLGQVGSSGYSTGPHLHFEVQDAGRAYQDPFDGPCNLPRSFWTSQGAYADLPDAICLAPAACVPTATLTCGEVLDTDNTGPGSTSSTWRYGCDDFVYDGPERTFAFRTALDQPVTVSVTGLSADLDVHVVDDPACDGQGCVASSSNPDGGDESLTFDAVADQDYVVVVDGWEGATSAFHLEVDCAPDPGPVDSASVPTAETGPVVDPPPDTGPVEDPGGGDETIGAGPGGVVARPAEEGGCGCATGTPAALPWLVLPLVLRRRARRA